MINSRYGVSFLGLFTCTAWASSVVIGLPAIVDSGNCIPFGCDALFGTTTYQQVYTASAFSGPFDIDGIDFFNTQFLNGGLPGGGVYTFTLSYTSESPGALNLTNPLNNIGSGSQEFFSGALPAISGDLMSFAGTPFLYNPALGNLLLTVTITGGTNGSTILYLDQSQSAAQTSRAYFGTDTGGNDPGLVTQFDSAVPEPSFLIPTLTSLGILGYIRKRKRSI
ncbi:MAG TPA: hypothetical protein VIY49_24610 [Bryobacteraceae bacterium]